ncbi:MAG TPA: hypothetical protein VMD57_01830, partial [Candidatus Baltobacteraceae bacterium]|nr:hypothetical protein [Candidatus Baltobacteraceae bacterium]
MNSMCAKDHGIISRLCLLALLTMPLCTVATPPDVSEVASNIVARDEGFWRNCTKRPESVTSRDLFAYALALCEARQYPERLDRLFTLAEQMQDRDPKSRSYGNFWWTMSDGKVMDYNAVDFAMRG